MKLQMSEHRRVRIYTVPKVAAEVAGTYSGATVIETTGYWMGIPEDAVIVEVVSDDQTFLDLFVQDHAKVAHALGEEAILVTDEPVMARMVDTGQAWIESIK